MYDFCATYSAISIYSDATKAQTLIDWIVFNAALVLMVLTNQGMRQKKIRSDCKKNSANERCSTSKPALIEKLMNLLVYRNKKNLHLPNGWKHYLTFNHLEKKEV